MDMEKYNQNAHSTIWKHQKQLAYFPQNPIIANSARVKLSNKLSLRRHQSKPCLSQAKGRGKEQTTGVPLRDTHVLVFITCLKPAKRATD